MTDDLTRNISAALSARRPSPSRDLADRLAAAAAHPRSRPRFFVPAVLALSVAALALVVLATRPGETGGERHVEVLPVGGGGANPPAGPVLDPDRLPAYQALLDGTAGLPLTGTNHDPRNKECMSCHEHATIHDRRFTNQQCLSCHSVPGAPTVQRDKVRDAALELARQRALHLERKRVAEIELRKQLAVAEPDTARVAAAFDAVAAEVTAISRAELVARLAARAALDPAQRAEIENGKPAPKPGPTPAPAPMLSTLAVHSTIPGSVYIDGKAVGTTPVRVQLANGKHLVRVEYAGYEATMHTVDLKGANTELELEPGAPAQPAATGTLYVTATPFAVVVIDGKTVGETPVKVTLPAGRHKLLMTTSTGDKQTRVITLEAGKTVNVNADLRNNP